MELKKNQTCRLGMKFENVVYEGYDPEYIIKEGHGMRKGFHIFRSGNRRFALTEDEVNERVITH